jgi:hypothetical protein
MVDKVLGKLNMLASKFASYAKGNGLALFFNAFILWNNEAVVHYT